MKALVLLILVLMGLKPVLAANFQPAVNGVYLKGELIINRNTYRVHWKGEKFDATVVEMNLLEAILAHYGLAVPYEQLLEIKYGGYREAIGNPANPYARTADLATSIKRLKQKFEAIDPGFDEIENYKGFGYRWKMLEVPLPAAEQLAAYGNLLVHSESKSLFWKGVRINTTVMAFDIVQRLVKRHSDGMKCEEFLQVMDSASTSAVSSNIHRINEMFREVDPDFNCIKLDRTAETNYVWVCQ